MGDIQIGTVSARFQVTNMNELHGLPQKLEKSSKKSADSLTKGLEPLSGSLDETTEGWKNLGEMMEKTTGVGALGLGTLAAGVALVTAAVTIGLQVWQNWNTIKDKFGDGDKILKPISDWMEDTFPKSVDAAKEKIDEFNQGFAEGKDARDDLITSYNDYVDQNTEGNDKIIKNDKKLADSSVSEWGRISNAIGSATMAVVDAGGQVLGLIKDLGSGWLDSILNVLGISGPIDDLTSKFIDLVLPMDKIGFALANWDLIIELVINHFTTMVENFTTGIKEIRKKVKAIQDDFAEFITNPLKFKFEMPDFSKFWDTLPSMPPELRAALGLEVDSKPNTSSAMFGGGDTQSNTSTHTTLQTGTEYVPKDGLYQLHKGETVTPQSVRETRATNGGNVVTVNITNNINSTGTGGPSSMFTLDEINESVYEGVNRAIPNQ